MVKLNQGWTYTINGRDREYVVGHRKTTVVVLCAVLVAQVWEERCYAREDTEKKISWMLLGLEGICNQEILDRLGLFLTL